MDKVMNVVVAGLGGQGVIKVADIVSTAAFMSGFDVKQSEVHGMSQRGGSVNSDVRYGKQVWSPMVPAGEADFLLVMDPTQVENNQQRLKQDGCLITPSLFLGDDYDDIEDLNDDEDNPITQRNFNIAMLGALSHYLNIDEAIWTQAIQANLPARAHAENLEVFGIGRQKSAESV